MRFYQACEVLGVDPEHVNAYACYRDADQIFRSDFNLWNAKPETASYENNNQRRYCQAIKDGNFLAFKQIRWEKWIGQEDPYTFWTNGDSRVNTVQYSKLSDEWPKICEAAGCREIPKLPQLDFQLNVHKALACK